MTLKTINVPDIGDFDKVPVIEVLVGEGDTVAPEDSLVTLESDKATMDIPAPEGGVVKRVLVKVGDELQEGSPILELETASQVDALAAGSEQQKAREEKDESGENVSAPAPEPAARSGELPDADMTAQVVVLGSGPGGYTAAFRAADLGLDTILVERFETLGGVCLNVGCIPSKALLHTAEVITMADAMSAHGVEFGAPSINIVKLRGFKDSVVKKLTGGLSGMAGKRKVRVVTGTGSFLGPNQMAVETAEGKVTIAFEKAIIAAGSSSIKLPGLPWDDDRLMDSTDALELKDIPDSMLVIGGGIIGLEMASVYQALGTRITVCEMLDQLMPGADPDIVRPFQRIVSKRYESIHLKSKVTRVESGPDGLTAWFEGPKVPEKETYDRILVAVGRRPNGLEIGADQAGVEVTDRGFVPVDKQMRTNVPHIFAIGDIVGQPMLAHKATHEAKVAAEVCAGEKSAFDARVIPSVAYTDPEVAWVGLTEGEAKESGIEVGKATFPWAASGRALGLDRSEGATKLLFDEKTDRVVGAAIVGPHAGDLIAECALAIEMGCTAEDIGLTIHPHPTLSETVAMASEMFEGTITDLYAPKKKGK